MFDIGLGFNDRLDFDVPLESVWDVPPAHPADAGYHGGGSSTVDPGFNDLTGNYLDEGSQTSAEAMRDENLGLWNQLIGSLTGENQKILQELQQASAKAQYDYLERMSSSAYQRAVADMKKAGLNPAVMFMNGAGSSASTPTVQQAQVATENQLLSFFSSAGILLNGIGSVLGSILGNLLPKTTKSYIESLDLSNLIDSGKYKGTNIGFGR